MDQLVTDDQRLAVAREFARLVREHEVPGPDLVTVDAHSEGSTFGSALPKENTPDLRARLETLAAADGFDIDVREFHAVPGERVITVGVVSDPANAALMAARYDYDGPRICDLCVFQDVGEAFRSVGLVWHGLGSTPTPAP